MAEKFYGVKLTDMTGKVYYTEIEVKHGLNHKISVQSHLPIDSKFPIHTRIGRSSYWSGTITGAFENNQDGECEHDYKFGDVNFRINFIEWLHNGLTKTMTLSDELILPVAILGDIGVDIENAISDPKANVSFEWEQCGERINSEVQLNCPDCGQVVVPTTKFCPNCGKAVNSNG